VVEEPVGAAGHPALGAFGEGTGAEPVPHGGAVHPHAAGDPPQGHPSLAQLDDALVSLQAAGAPLLAPCGPVVRWEPLLDGLRLRRLRRQPLGLPTRRHGLGGFQDVRVMPVDRPHQRLPQVHQQVPAIGHLDRL
jgi:hypothetical protein